MQGNWGEQAGLSEPLLPPRNGHDDIGDPQKPQQGPPSSDDLEEAAVLGQLPAVAAAWAAVHEVFEEPPRAYPQSSLWDTTMNLTNAILGAGMLALPHAFAGLGVLGGVVLTAAVGVMTHASIALMLRPTERSGKLTYAAVMQHEWGRWAGTAVRFSIIIGSAGFLVLYLVILADLLVGSEEYSGIIPDLWPKLPNPLPWALQRTAVLTWVMLLVAPALIPKTLGEVALISVIKILCTVMCVAALLVLVVALLLQGRLPQVHWLPCPAFFGDGPWTRLKNVLAIVPVVMTAFVCHMSVHPCVQDLHNYTPTRMRTAVAWSLFISGTVYALTGVAGFCVWGSKVEGDVLSDLDITFVGDALWGNVPLAMAFVVTVKVAMAASMVLSFPITIWPMRQDIIEMLAEHFGTTRLTPFAYYLLTYMLLFAIYIFAICIQSAYRVVGLVGSTLGTNMAFIFPGMLALRDQQGGLPFRVFGWALMLAGVVLTVIGVISADDG